MTETSEGGVQGQQPRAQVGLDQGGQDPSAASSARPPAWRRRVLITGLAVVAAAAAAVVVGLGPLARQHTSLPPPCALVSARTVARYLPGGATSTPLGSPVPYGCRWVSAGPQVQFALVVGADVFGSSSGATLARKAFNADAHSAMISGSGTTTIRQSVTGLGDQAVAQRAQLGKGYSPQTPIVVVDVRSRNTVVTVFLSINVLEAVSAPPTGPQLLSDTIAIGRDVLAVLAGQTG